MNDLQFYILFNSISVITGRWEGERLCVVASRLRLEGCPPPAGHESRTSATGVSINTDNLRMSFSFTLCCDLSLEPSRGDGSKEWPQHIFSVGNKKKNISQLLSKFYFIWISNGDLVNSSLTSH